MIDEYIDDTSNVKRQLTENDIRQALRKLDALEHNAQVQSTQCHNRLIRAREDGKASGVRLAKIELFNLLHGE